VYAAMAVSKPQYRPGVVVAAAMAGVTKRKAWLAAASQWL